MTYTVREFDGSLFDFVLLDKRGNEMPLAQEELDELIDSLESVSQQ